MNRFAELHHGGSREAPAPDEHWSERRKLADRVRALIAEVTSADASAEVYQRAIEHVERAIAALADMPHYAGLLANTRDLGLARFVAVAHELNPIYGIANPLSPPLEMHRSADRAFGRVTFGAPYEGPPGHVHGGHIAAVFDQFLGFAQTLAGLSGVTGKLALRYVRPTPLNADLELEGWIEERIGRLVYVEGVLRTAGVVTAKATAMFVEVPNAYLSR
jgi:hypothetical protein